MDKIKFHDFTKFPSNDMKYKTTVFNLCTELMEKVSEEAIDEKIRNGVIKHNDNVIKSKHEELLLKSGDSFVFGNVGFLF